MAGVKQLISRIDDDLHRRVKERARIEKRSVNSIVIEALEAKVVRNERERVRGKLRDAGMLDEPRPAPVDVPSWDEIEDLTRGMGRVVSEALEADRAEDW